MPEFTTQYIVNSGSNSTMDNSTIAVTHKYTESVMATYLIIESVDAALYSFLDELNAPGAVISIIVTYPTQVITYNIASVLSCDLVSSYTEEGEIRLGIAFALTNYIVT